MVRAFAAMAQLGKHGRGGGAGETPLLAGGQPAPNKRRRVSPLEDSLSDGDPTRLLDKYLGPEYVRLRSGPGGSQVSYLGGDDAVSLANRLFGNDKWSSEIVWRDVAVTVPEGEERKWTVHVVFTVRVTVQWTPTSSSCHEGTGYGGGRKAGSRGEAMELAVKEAETDALKRALRLFGEALGNCVYNKDYLVFLHGVKKKDKRSRRTFDVDDLLRSPANAGGQQCLDRVLPSRGGVSVNAGDEFDNVGDEFFDDAGFVAV